MKDENSFNTANLTNQELKSQVIILENKLKKETIKYRQNKLLEKISNLKKLYVANDEYDIPIMNNTFRLSIDVYDKENGGNNEINTDCEIDSKFLTLNEKNLKYFKNNTMYKKVCIENICGASLAFDCDDLSIDSCNRLNLTVKITGSIFIHSVNESIIKVNSEQVRLVNCKNIKLVVMTRSGIVLENSENITIEEWKSQHMNYENLYRKVNDFSDPFSGRNYKII